ncbi:MAG: hypothetical protein U5L06_06260 [Rhodovibrio sp.]|nr:hypothetical protein [Rhodovibrio sp.]
MAPLSLARIEELFHKTLGADEGAQAFAAIETVHDLPGLARRPILARYIGEVGRRIAGSPRPRRDDQRRHRVRRAVRAPPWNAGQAAEGITG